MNRSDSAPEADWFFGYGSLMWRPGFSHVERAAARLNGYHRAFSVYSRRHRGTADRPGLVLGLAPGGHCDGMAYRVSPRDRADVLAYLDDRELVGYPYFRTTAPLTVWTGPADIRAVRAVVYLPNTEDERFVGDLPLATAARTILGAAGMSGTNRDYLASTRRHLDELGIDEPSIRRLDDEVARLASVGAPPDDV